MILDTLGRFGIRDIPPADIPSADEQRWREDEARRTVAEARQLKRRAEALYLADVQIDVVTRRRRRTDDDHSDPDLSRSL